MTRTIIRRAVLAALLLASAGCASTVSGDGSAARRSSSAPSTAQSSAPSTEPSATSSPPPSTEPSSVPSSAPQPSTPPSAPPSSAPVSAPPPPGCTTTASCPITQHRGLLGGLYLQLRSTDSAAYLELLDGDTPVAWHRFEYEHAGDLVCDLADNASLRNCTVTTGIGAHGANAYPVVVDGDVLHVGQAVNTDTPIIDAYDIDGDHRVDAALLLNNYQPSYAAGQVQWQTYRRSADGRTLVATGCGVLSTNHEPPPRPSAFEHGPCQTG